MPDQVADYPETFGSALRRLRRAAGLSLADLGSRVHCSKSQLSKIENEYQGIKATVGLAEKCDEVLNADGQLVAAFGLAQSRLIPPGDPAFLDKQSRQEALRRLVASYRRSAATADRALVPPRFQPPGVNGETEMAAMSFDDQAQAMKWCHAESVFIPRLCWLAFDLDFYDECWRLAYVMRDYFFAAKAIELWISSHSVALHAAERLGDKWAQAVTRNNLGMAWVEQQDTVAAEDQYRQALELFRAIDDQRGVATTLGHLAWANFAAGRHDDAVSLAEQARELNRGHNDRRSLAIMDRTAALAHAKSGRYSEALALLAECQEILPELNLPLDDVMALNCLGEVHFMMGQFRKARTFHALAKERSATCCGPRELARAVKGLAVATQAGN
jgi:transcriptional regulator with XRE-family HTH domain